MNELSSDSVSTEKKLQGKTLSEWIAATGDERRVD